MITGFDKAILSVLGLFVYGLNTWAGVDLGMDPGMLATIAAIITPLLVWIVPNKDASVV